jgi:cyclic-di-GMP phosphodiesterase TipF (flagellum assembly factor)
MVRISAIFIAICMVLIAGSIGAMLFLGLHMTPPVSAIAALSALIVMMLFNTVSNRLRDRRVVNDQLAELSRATGDLARQVVEIGRRVHAADGRGDRPRSGADPIATELSELGTLVKQLAETVAAHETELYRRIAVDGNAPVPPPASLSPADVAAMPAATPAKPAAETAAPAAAVPPPGLPRRFAGLSRDAVVTLIANAVESSRIDLYLQPIVTLPQRKVRFYEAVSRLRTEDGEIIPAADFIEQAEAAGLMPKIDNLLLFRCVQVMRRLQLKNREVGLFCNVSGRTLSDGTYFPQVLEFMEANRALAPNLVFEFGQAAVRNFGPIEEEALAALAERGFRFSMDTVTDLRIEPRWLTERSFRFVKTPAKLLLGRGAGAQTDIHPEDLADLLGRNGIDLIGERIESESMVVDLLDYDVRFGQGFLFSPPRPVRAEALQSSAPSVDLPADLPASSIVSEGSPELVAAAARR